MLTQQHLDQHLDSSNVVIKKNKIPHTKAKFCSHWLCTCKSCYPVIMYCAVLPGKQDRALMETLTAETANSSPRETQLITRATTPNKHTLGRARGVEKFKCL